MNLTDLSVASGFDFSKYSEPFVLRRVHARMLRLSMKEETDYLAYLRAHPEEKEKLHCELSIHVTHFFRDKAMYDVLMLESLFDLMKRKDIEGRRLIRIWSAGCSSGEEPYSVAIMAKELLGSRSDFHISIIGTDMDDDALELAGIGAYGEEQLKEADPDIIKKYFNLHEGRYYINDDIKKLVTFQKGDMLTSSKPKQVDVIFCRNVVIYFSKEIKEKLYEDFYDCLLPGGILILGKTETLTGNSREKFKVSNISERIYTKSL
ncbi:MAG: protein-glutamate O-methyltransferase CheR [archaeon]